MDSTLNARPAPRDAYLKRSLGTLSRRIRESRVLLVGAGGIGCELLKNLLLTGFGEIHIVDLDTIDLSNLNRQFLFRHEHIKKSKALVAKEVAGKFRPDSKLEAYHANIKDLQFNVDWFATFDVVFNALDNLDARRHVNRMCLTADVPLVESGTTGFNGQVQVIKKNVTIARLKKYQRHSQFVLSGGAVRSEEIENLRREAQALKAIRASIGSEGFAQRVFDKVFKDDIERLRGMEDMWKTRKPPTALKYESLQEKTPSEKAPSVEAGVSQDDQRVWTLEENFSVFKDRQVVCLDRLSKRLKDLQANKTGDIEPIITFDKDDVDTLDFVACSANLRSAIFDIESKSKFDIKQMAGNIIPAIATTNAMTAGLCVLQAFKVLRDDYDHAKMVFLERSGVRAINSEILRPPNPFCAVCSVAQGKVLVDLEHATLKDLVEDTIRGKLGYGEEFSINTDAGMIYDPDLEDNLPKKLIDFGIQAETLLTVIDENDESPFVNLELVVEGRTKAAADEKSITLAREIDIPKKPKQVPAVNGTITNGTIGHKRKRDAEEVALPGEPESKRVAADGDNNEPIVLDDPDTGAIVIDD
ncbi:hypothetical protein UA08_07223 [Talaromyces atroroseus]|uniref:Ubiquitin-activating enzyme E1-like n=1 Tax=Talaromyces atroroseus TaxID=1441469 RepID=A0A225AEH1_TALAT|nr:hypothetical protein UA08_07223 [Talaromyces atroroseus]OKL57453.1 hypothetical protein UA08_07223 [Talaromyces atroroseus]